MELGRALGLLLGFKLGAEMQFPLYPEIAFDRVGVAGLVLNMATFPPVLQALPTQFKQSAMTSALAHAALEPVPPEHST
jgi:hypothetical protein